MFTLKAHVDTHGPIFRPGAAEIMEDAVEDAVGSIARYAEEAVDARFVQVLQHPTGRYQSTIHTVHHGHWAQIRDRDAVYGPWLEGTGSRNAPVTRFKGYATFRKTTQAVESAADHIAQPQISQAVRRLS